MGKIENPGKKRISIVSPVFNEEGALPIFYPRLRKVLEPLRARYDFDIIFTNNASSDASLDLIRGYHAEDNAVQVVTLSRNFGYTASVLSGITHAQGDATIVIDPGASAAVDELGNIIVTVGTYDFEDAEHAEHAEDAEEVANVESE